MVDLKRVYESLGLSNVVTYIQSGNVVFDSNNNDVFELKVQLEKGIEDAFGFSVPVEIRTHDELKQILDNHPFDPQQVEADKKRFLVTFLSKIPDPIRVESLQPFVQEEESLIVKGREVYLHCPESYGKSKLSNNLLEKKLRVSATTRNWKTVTKLLELSKP